MFEKVKSVLAQQFELDPESITMDTNLIDDLGADSLDVVELIMGLETEFDIETYIKCERIFQNCSCIKCCRKNG